LDGAGTRRCLGASGRARSTTATDWQVLLYTAGRAMLWLVVISACLSMYGYFMSFYRSVVANRKISADYADYTDSKKTSSSSV
jgi:hypothetical protein